MSAAEHNAKQPQFALPDFVIPGKAGWHIRIKVQPGTGKNELGGSAGGTLRIKLTAPAVENKANVALLGFLARLLAIRKNGILLASGEKSRNKLIFISAELKPNWDALLYSKPK